MGARRKAGSTVGRQHINSGERCWASPLSVGSRRGAKQSDLGYFLKGESKGLPVELEVECERKRRQKNESKNFDN